MDKQQIIQALEKVNDPKTGKDLITMRMVENLQVEGDNVSFTVTLPQVDADTKSQINFACIAAVNEVYPQANVHVHLSMKSAFAEAGVSEKAFCFGQFGIGIERFRFESGFGRCRCLRTFCADHVGFARATPTGARSLWKA